MSQNGQVKAAAAARPSARRALRDGLIGWAILGLGIALGECSAGCSSGQQLVAPITDWVDNPSFEASADAKLEDGELSGQVGLDLGWIEGVYNTESGFHGCINAPIQLCFGKARET